MKLRDYFEARQEAAGAGLFIPLFLLAATTVAAIVYCAVSLLH